MGWFDLIGWVASLMGIFAAILNIMKNRWCFVLWTVSGMWLIYANFEKGMPYQAMLLVSYIFLNVFGWVVWSKKLRDSGVIT